MFDRQAWMKEYMKQYRETHREQINKNARKYVQTHRDHQRKYLNNYRQQHPEINRAEIQARRHCPLGPSCQFGGCGSTENLERAHMDYSKPLEVLTFCVKHHRLIDRIYRRFD